LESLGRVVLLSDAEASTVSGIVPALANYARTGQPHCAGIRFFKSWASRLACHRHLDMVDDEKFLRHQLWHKFQP